LHWMNTKGQRNEGDTTGSWGGKEDEFIIAAICKCFFFIVVVIGIVIVAVIGVVIVVIAIYLMHCLLLSLLLRS